MAEDLVQDTFFSALKSLSGFQGKSHEKTWLTAILKRKIIDFYRKKSTSNEVSLVDSDDHFTNDGMMKGGWAKEKAPKKWSSEAHDAMESAEFMSILQKCISHLPQKWASCFILSTVEEMESKEVCKELDITASNMWVILHRARLQLRDCIEKGW